MKKLLTEDYYNRLIDVVGSSVHTTKEMYELISAVNAEFGVKSAENTMCVRLTNFCNILEGAMTKMPDTDTAKRGRGVPMLYCIEDRGFAEEQVKQFFSKPVTRKRKEVPVTAGSAIGAVIAGAGLGNRLSLKGRESASLTVKNKLLHVYRFFMDNLERAGSEFEFSKPHKATQMKDTINRVRENAKILVPNYWVNTKTYKLPSRNEMVGILLSIDSYVQETFGEYLDTAIKLKLAKVSERTAETKREKDEKLITYRSFIIAGILLTESRPVTDVEVIKALNNRFNDRTFDRISLQECIEKWGGKLKLTQSPVGKIVVGSSRLDLLTILSNSDPRWIVDTVYARIGVSLENLRSMIGNSFNVSLVSKISEDDGIYKLDVNYSTESRAAFAKLYMSFRGNDTLINDDSKKISSQLRIMIAQMTQAYKSQHGITEFEEMVNLEK